MVFDDYNQDGTQGAREPGSNGVVVIAYNSAGNSVGTATSSSINGTLGQYSITVPAGTGAVRVQFSNFGSGATLPALTMYQPSSHVAPPVQFVSGTNSANTVNLGLEYPSEYCQNNPNVATSCYVRGGINDNRSRTKQWERARWGPVLLSAVFSTLPRLCVRGGIDAGARFPRCDEYDF
jgi:SdrD B-like domain